jgi:hypothetical protein
MSATYPTSQEIREAMLARVDKFCELTNMRASVVCKAALSDPNFFANVKDGRNFTVATYDRLNAWLDKEARKRGLRLPKFAIKTCA